MAQKNVWIAGRRCVVNGDNRDRYFRESVPDEGVFVDAPIVVATQCCPRDGIVLDVGANIGISTLAFAQIASKGRVIAFEPSSRNFALLLSNLEANRLTNVSAVKTALSNVEATVTLLEDPEFMAGNRVNPEAGSPPGESEDVKATTLDAEVSRHGLQRIDLIKVDVEGHEHQVLEGASSTLEKFRPPCVIEFNSYTLVYHQHVAPLDFLKFLQGVFPRIFHFDRRSYALRDLAGRESEFLELNAATGFVDDLVCAFGELPSISAFRIRSASAFFGSRGWLVRARATPPWRHIRHGSR